MIVVTIQLKSAVTGKTTTLGVMHIANDGKGTDARSNYDGAVMRKPTFERVTKEGHVAKWPRHQKTIWHLVAKMLSNMGYT